MKRKYQSSLYQVNKFLKLKADRKLRKFLVNKRPFTIASLINRLETGKVKAFGILPPEIQAEVAVYLDEPSKKLIFMRLSDFTIARMLYFIDEDDAVDILQSLPILKQEHIVEKMKPPKKQRVEKLLRFHPETAGGIMDMNFITVSPDTTLKQAAEKIKKYAKKTNQTPVVISVKKDGTITGYVPQANFIFRASKVKIKNVTKAIPLVHFKIDQEQVLKKILSEKTKMLGVVDDNNTLIGIINARDLIRVVQEEATEDLYRFAGLISDEASYTSVFQSVKLRSKWLILNLISAFIASYIISFFQKTISQMAILAAFMPVIAGIGGNNGSQSVALIVRGIALSHISWDNGKKIILKQAITGAINGIIVGTIGALPVFLMTHNSMLAFVFFLAMTLNLFISGLFGGFIPLALKSLGADPAIASSIFVTGSIDIFGFFIFLGLASYMLF